MRYASMDAYWGALRGAVAALTPDATPREWETVWRLLAAWPCRSALDSEEQAAHEYVAAAGRNNPELLEGMWSTAWMLGHYRKLPVPSLGAGEAQRWTPSPRSYAEMWPPPAAWGASTRASTENSGSVLTVIGPPSLAAWLRAEDGQIKLRIGEPMFPGETVMINPSDEVNRSYVSREMLGMTGPSEWRAGAELLLKVARELEALAQEAEADPADPADGGPELRWTPAWVVGLNKGGPQRHPKLTFQARRALSGEDWSVRDFARISGLRPNPRGGPEPDTTPGPEIRPGDDDE